MTFSIAREQPGQPEVEALIAALDDYQKPLYPPESHHGIDIAELARPNVLFAVARDAAGVAVGCGAVVVGAGWGELKRMFVVPALRGNGISRQLLEFLESGAVAAGCTRLMLETGVQQHAALALYARAGYRDCGPFGDYTHDPHSVFMSKEIG